MMTNRIDQIRNQDVVSRDRLKEIRQRRAALTGANQLPQLPFRIRWAESDTDFDGVLDAMGDEVCCITHWGDTKPTTEFIAAAPADIDYLLGELAASKENADHSRKSCEMLSESVLKLTDEVERLRAENLNLGRTLQEVYVTYAPETEPEREVYRLVAEAIGVSNPMQQLTDLSQELGLYEEADNPLVKYEQELTESGLLDEFERQTKETDT